MNEVKYQNIDQHVKILSWLYIGISILGLLVGLGVFLLLIFVGFAAGDPEAARILPIVAMFSAGFIFIFSLPGIVAGWGLLKRKSWARLLALIIAFLNLLNFPVGTLAGVYAIWVLLQDGAQEYFLEPKLA